MSDIPSGASRSLVVAMGKNRFRILCEILRRKGDPPSVKELMDVTGIHNPQGVSHHLLCLKKQGYIDWEDGKARTLTARVRFVPESALEPVEEAE